MVISCAYLMLICLHIIWDMKTVHLGVLKKVTSVFFKLFCQNRPNWCAGALKNTDFGQKVESAKMHFDSYTCFGWHREINPNIYQNK